MGLDSCLSDRTRGNGHKLKHGRLCLNLWKSFFYCESYGAQARVAQRGCVVSILGDIQRLSGHDLGQLAVGSPTSARGWPR